MSIQHINPDTLFRLPGLSQIVVAPAGRLAFVAGQTARDNEMNLVGGDDLFSQATQAFRNLKTALAAVGAEPKDVVSSNMYVVGLDPKAMQAIVSAMNQALDGAPFPPNASTLVGVQRLGSPEILFEVSAIASITN
jgi:2-iminobutanoate/2-iminopropanoate deaminase